ncbi:hypothetical protein [Hamadaea tsunoensis]|nr:hypothetical protein [Hamadaea tsunoensis]
MKIPTPIVTLIVGILIAVVVAILSVRAHNDAHGEYGLRPVAGVIR